MTTQAAAGPARPRRTIALVALVAAMGPLMPVDAAPSPLRWRMWRVTREGTAPRPLDMDVAVTPASAESMAFVVGLRGTGSTRRTVQWIFWEHGGSYPLVYRDGSTTSTCPSSSCDNGGGDEVIHLPMASSSPIKDKYLIVTWAGAAKPTFTTKGWRVREVGAPSVRRVLARSTGATGVYANAASAERYTGGSAPGGSAGSVAWAALPCDYAGYGDGQLVTQPASPTTSQQLDCADTAYASAFAARAVRWTVAADVIGTAGGAPVTRLLVLGLPK